MEQFGGILGDFVQGDFVRGDFVLGGFCPGGFCPGDFVRRGFVRGDFVLEPSQTTSYRPISLLSTIMNLFEQFIEKRLQKHLEDNGFFSKYQSGFRKSKSTNDHLFRLSQIIMESFNWSEHVIVVFLDVEKAFDNVWHNGLRYKFYQL